MRKKLTRKALYLIILLAIVLSASSFHHISISPERKAYADELEKDKADFIKAQDEYK